MARLQILVVAGLLCWAGGGHAGPAGLAGSEWGLEADAKGKKGPYIQFRAHGKVHGSDGCNIMFGRYQVTGNEIEIGGLAGTRKLCPQPVMKRARGFTSSLRAARKYVISNDQLILQDEAGETILRLRRRAQ